MVIRSFSEIAEAREELKAEKARLYQERKALENRDKWEWQKRVMLKAVEDWCTITEAKQSARVNQNDWKHMKEDDWFLQELEYAIDSDIRLAKSKVRLGLEKDDCEEFALKVLKAKRPSEYWTQIVNSKNEITAEVEHKSVDDMLIEYYQEE